MSVPVYRRLYGTGRWRVTSAYVIAQADGRCEIQGPRCTGIATTADHVIPARQLAERGELHRVYDLRLLRAACRPCNSALGAEETTRRRRGRPRPPRRVVSAEQAAIA